MTAQEIIDYLKRQAAGLRNIKEDGCQSWAECLAHHAWLLEIELEQGGLIRSTANGGKARRLAFWRCVHCKRVTVIDEGEPSSGDKECECGAEFYPVSRTIVLGRPLTLAQVGGEPLGYLVERTAHDKPRENDAVPE